MNTTACWIGGMYVAMMDHRGGISSLLRCTFAQEIFGLFETEAFAFLCASFVFRAVASFWARHECQDLA
jgi:hypothetical protein